MADLEWDKVAGEGWGVAVEAVLVAEDRRKPRRNAASPSEEFGKYLRRSFLSVFIIRWGRSR